MKLYDRNAPLFTGTSSLPPFEDSVAPSDPAVVAVEGKESPRPVAASRRLPQRTVRFHDIPMNVYNSNVTKEECQALWYSEEDIHLFRLQNRNHIRRLRHLDLSTAHMSTTTPSWGNAYSQVYHACCQVRNEHDNDSVSASLENTTNAASRCTMDVLTAGMERRAVPAVVRDTLTRRRKLWNEVLHWQNSVLCRHNDMLRERMVREMSLALSRPARLYAHHIAVVSAATEW